MLKTVGMGAVFLSCTAIGFCMSAELRERVKELGELERIVQILKGEIEYAGTPLQEAFEEAAARTDKKFQNFFGETVKQMRQNDGRTLKVVVEDCAKKELQGSSLKKDDIQRFCKMCGRLGYLDCRMQLQILEMYARELAKERGEAQEDYRQKEKIYRQLGAAAGIFFVLLLL
ncbi:MAG: stage III sporulation protein AB [Marvinbryantia sp.]|jgi:stage III sporulation protein AB